MTVPAQVFSLAAIRIGREEDPHLRAGVHLRWAALPALGLPDAPIELSRAALTEDWNDRCPPQPIIWTIGPRGQTYQPPFSIDTDEVAYGRLSVPSGDLAIAVLVRVAGIYPQIVTGGFIDERGYIPAVSANDAGWLAAAGIEELRVPGPARIVEAYWFSLSCLQDMNEFEGVAYVGPPFQNQLSRYNPIPLENAEEAARARVEAGAPLRIGLHETFEDSEEWSPNKEWARVWELTSRGLADRYFRLLDDISRPQNRLLTQEDLLNERRGTSVGQADLPLLFLLYSACNDASIARWAGLSYVDVDPQLDESRPYLYRIRASFNPMGFDSDDERFQRFERNIEQAQVNSDWLELPMPGKLLAAYALVDPKLQPPQVAPPVALAPAQQKRWVSGGANLRRLVTLPFQQAIGSVGYALHRRDNTGLFSAMNALYPGSDARILATPAEDRLESNPDRRWFSDPAAPAEAQSYGVAAVDLFGRWSSWTTFHLPPGELLLPPTPVPRAFYLVTDPSPDDDSPRAGQIRVQIALPSAEPPGVPSISQAEIRLEVEEPADPTLSVRTVAVAVGGAAIDEIFDGPLLRRSEVRKVAVLVRFLSGPLASEIGQVEVTAADPRPPRPLAIEPRLQWATRPDAQDSSRVRLSWSAGSDHAGYRVYRASTRTLEDYLRSLGEVGQVARAAVQDRSLDAPALVRLLENLPGGFPRSAFELLNRTLVSPSEGSSCVFDSILPGRSRLLYIYRIAAVATTGVEEDWMAPPAYIWVAVPPSIQLQPPTLSAEVAREITARPGVRLMVSVHQGQPAAAVRIFRTSSTTTALPGQMAQIYEAPLDLPIPPDPASLDTEASIRAPLAQVEYLDDGPTHYTPNATLRPWVRYIYRAQIQSAAVVGGPAGVWSDLSAPAMVTVVPNTEPPVAQVTATRREWGVELRWVCSELITSVTPLGDFRFRILRTSPSEWIPRELVTLRAVERKVFRDETANRGLYAYQIETIDPVGRRRLSEPVEVAAVP